MMEELKKKKTQKNYTEHYYAEIILELNSFPNDKFWTNPNWKRLQTTILILMKMAKSYPNG